MKKDKGFGRYEKLWISEILWSVAQVTTLWSAILGELDPFIRTESKIISNNAAAIDEIRMGKLVGELSTIICRRRNYLKVIQFIVKEDKDNSNLFNLQ